MTDPTELRNHFTIYGFVILHSFKLTKIYIKQNICQKYILWKFHFVIAHPLIVIHGFDPKLILANGTAKSLYNTLDIHKTTLKVSLVRKFVRLVCNYEVSFFGTVSSVNSTSSAGWAKAIRKIDFQTFDNIYILYGQE